jgi:hypothetical protein
MAISSILKIPELGEIRLIRRNPIEEDHRAVRACHCGTKPYPRALLAGQDKAGHGTEYKTYVQS